MEAHVYDLSESISSKLYELNALIMRASDPNPVMNLMPGASDFHPSVRPFLYGK